MHPECLRMWSPSEVLLIYLLVVLSCALSSMGTDYLGWEFR